MYQPSTTPYQEHRGFKRTFRQGHLSLGLFFPLEAFEGDTPRMLDQVEPPREFRRLFGVSHAAWADSVSC